jgi:hypothetical protein
MIVMCKGCAGTRARETDGVVDEIGKVYFRKYDSWIGAFDIVCYFSDVRGRLVVPCGQGVQWGVPCMRYIHVSSVLHACERTRAEPRWLVRAPTCGQMEIVCVCVCVWGGGGYEHLRMAQRKHGGDTAAHACNALACGPREHDRGTHARNFAHAMSTLPPSDNHSVAMVDRGNDRCNQKVSCWASEQAWERGGGAVSAKRKQFRDMYTSERSELFK